MKQNKKESAVKNEILQAVAPDLADIEVALEENLTPQVGLVKKTARHILFAGGKRLRPLLSILSTRLCGRNKPADFTFSTIFEYLHAATLLHDDLVDGASLRRGKPVAHSVFGNETAVLTGDFLLARSLSIAAATGNPAIIAVIAEITELMSQGEIEQLQNRGRLDLSEAEYLEVIRRKTAILIQGACHAGALLAKAGDKQATALKTYGYHLGMAFQMADDLLDYTADPQTLGKAIGADLKEGKLTLPVIYSLATADSADRDRMVQMIGNKDVGMDDFITFVGLLTDYGGISYTRKKALAHVAAAKSALAGFEPLKERDLLISLSDYALIRNK
ncbi:MAG: polyprenyl synthetase family protein [Desulfobacterales bacterium]|jgi:octaprenyl-diphosphate synthase|nr:polyprenyl synthetase family protein [Desulfobacterales bacterium]